MSAKLSTAVALAGILAVALARAWQDPASGTASWDAARAAGYTAYLLIWSVVVAGMLINLRVRPGRGGAVRALEFHRISGALALAFAAVHVAALLVDPVVRFTPLDVAVGFSSGYEPVGVGLGAAALWLLLAVLVSTAFSARVRYGAWRAIHLLAYPAWALALGHALLAGTDAGSGGGLAVAAGSAAVVAAAAVYRLGGRRWVLSGQ